MERLYRESEVREKLKAIKTLDPLMYSESQLNEILELATGMANLSQRKDLTDHGKSSLYEMLVKKMRKYSEFFRLEITLYENAKASLLDDTKF